MDTNFPEDDFFKDSNGNLGTVDSIDEPKEKVMRDG